MIIKIFGTAKWDQNWLVTLFQRMSSSAWEEDRHASPYIVSVTVSHFDQNWNLQTKFTRTPQYHTLKYLINSLPGNGSVNSVQHATVDEAVFSMSSAPHPVLVTDRCIRSLTRDTCFLWGPCRRIIRGSRITKKAVQEGWVENSVLYGRLWRKELVARIWLWSEDFMYDIWSV
jgi:hypothetical protein